MEFKTITLGPERPTAIAPNFRKVEYCHGPLAYIVAIYKGERVVIQHGNSVTFDGPVTLMSEYSRTAEVIICLDGAADNRFDNKFSGEYLAYRGFVELGAVVGKRAGVALFREFGEMSLNYKSVKNCDVTFFPKAKLEYLNNKPAGFMDEGPARIVHASGDDEIMHLHTLTGYIDDALIADWITSTGYAGIPQKAVFQETTDTVYVPTGTAVFVAHTGGNQDMNLNLHLIDKGNMRSRYV